MSPEDRQELVACRQRIAELLYQDACEQGHSLLTLGEIETTVRAQLQTHVEPAIGEFFAKPSRARVKDTPAP